MANRFSVITTAMKKKTYDFLDQRKQEFDTDFDEFKRMVAELHVCIIYRQMFKFINIKSKCITCFKCTSLQNVF